MNTFAKETSGQVLKVNTFGDMPGIPALSCKPNRPMQRSSSDSALLEHGRNQKQSWQPAGSSDDTYEAGVEYETHGFSDCEHDTRSDDEATYDDNDEDQGSDAATFVGEVGTSSNSDEDSSLTPMNLVHLVSENARLASENERLRQVMGKSQNESQSFSAEGAASPQCMTWWTPVAFAVPSVPSEMSVWPMQAQAGIYPFGRQNQQVWQPMPSTSCKSAGERLGVGVECTTVMLRNLPNNYSAAMVLAMIDKEGFGGQYDFFYLPIDFSTRACLGYAFVNLVSAAVVPAFWNRFHGYSDWVLPSRKISSVSWSGPHQGISAHIERYRNSPVMHSSIPDKYKPMVFKDGVHIAFPPPTKAQRAPRIRHTAPTNKKEAKATRKLRKDSHAEQRVEELQ